jgi:hypothetical protein
MRLSLFFILLSVSGLHAQEPQPQVPAKPPEISQKDLQSYLDFARARATPLARQDNFATLARNSFDRVYLHQMRNGFYLKPSPRRVMKQIEDIFHEVDKARDTLRELRGNGASVPSRKDMRKIMDQLDHIARDIQANFQEYFNEVNRGLVSFQIPQLSELDLQWKFYLVRVDQCFGMLVDRLEQYFFNPEPARADLQDYHSAGIGTITKAIHELTRVYRAKLR